jgi:hypothetical protein
MRDALYHGKPIETVRELEAARSIWRMSILSRQEGNYDVPISISRGWRHPIDALHLLAIITRVISALARWLTRSKLLFTAVLREDRSRL